MGINTGTPGFDIDGKAYTYDVGDADRPEDPNYPIPADKGDITVDQNEPPTKDLSKTTKKTLASYLGRQTQLNYYRIDTTPVGPDASGYVTSDITVPGRTNETPRIPAPQETTRNSEWFTKGKKTIAGTTSDSPTLRNWKIGTEFTSPDPTLANLQKGKTTGATQGSLSGNELLPNIDKPDPNNPESFPSPKLGALETYTNAVLKNNRFTNTSRYVARSLDNGQVDNSPASQTAYLDDLSQDGRYNPTFYHPVYGNITAGRMAQLGVALPTRSTKEINLTKEGSSNNPTSDKSVLESYIPGATQVGAKVELIQLQAADVLRTLTDDEIPEFQYVNTSKGSWGSLNNQLDTFSGFSSVAMSILSLSLSTGLATIITSLGALMGLVASPSIVSNVQGTRILGRSSIPGVGNEFLGLTPTFNAYIDAVLEGVKVFFGTTASDTLSSSPGYSVVLARSVNRSILTLSDAITNVNKTQGVGSVAQTLLALIDLIKSSKIFNAMNVFALIGDLSLNQKTTYSNDVKNNTITARDRENLFRVKDKNGNYTTKLSWASDRTPSLYLIPKATQGLSLLTRNLGSYTVNGPSTSEIETRTYYNVVDNHKLSKEQKEKKTISRIDSEEVRKLEERLDAEYVPFYFHDIRTNEIVSFHAFIESIGDDYSASYDSIESFGRVEPVRIYKGTQRKISLSFIIAATSESDYSNMWEKINKLTTLVYPQYTEGRRQQTEINGSKYNFVQPFSQMIGAAPLIRIRLGNLFRSNYSRFALARLFGANLPDSKFGTEYDVTRLDSFADQYSDKISDLVQEAKNTTRDSTNFWYLNSDGLDLNADSADLPSVIVNNGNRNIPENIKNAKKLRIKYASDINKIPVTIVDNVRGDKDSCIIRVLTFNEAKNSGYWGPLGLELNSEEQQTLYQDLLRRYGSYDNDPAFYIEGGFYVTTKFNLMPSQHLLRRLSQKAIKELPVSETAEGLNDFLDPEKNALVKSFKSSGGKGLAGFIESMNLDWQDKRWDVSNKSTMAPMMCKVTISFSPVHDISPGLDSQGYNRAPIYPVGPFNHSNDDKG
jgi:hypothetical protein